MRCLMALAIVMMVVLATPSSASADLPPRPLGLTAGQFEHLRRLEAQPQHAAVVDMHASYKSERERSLEMTRMSDDILTVAYSGGIPATILWILFVAAAPL